MVAKNYFMLYNKNVRTKGDTKMTKEKLEQYYIEHLRKVLKAYRHDFRKIDYIKFAINDLREVRNGRGW